MPRLSPRGLGVTLICVLSLAAQQPRPAIPASPLNLDFAQGVAGAVPPYWELTQRMAAAGYSAGLQRQGCAGNVGCLLLEAPAEAKNTGLVVNMFDATAYRNASFQIRALVKPEAKPNGANASAGLWVRVIRPHGAIGFMDDTADYAMHSSNWQPATVVGRVDPDAAFIMMGLSLHGPGRAWIDDVSFTLTPDGAPITGWATPSATPVNLNFREPLDTPQSGWQVHPASVGLGYTAEIRRDGCRVAPQCGTLVSPDPPKRANATGNLFQRFDAAPYRGKIVKVTAWLRAESPDPSAYSFLWVRVDDHLERFTTEENPVRPGDWQMRELRARIDPDARIIQLCVASYAARVTWIDSVTFEIDGMTAPAPISLQFEETAPGRPPLSWTVGAGKSSDSYSVQTTKSGCETGPFCVVIASPAEPTFFNLTRTLQGISRAGHQFNLRAWVKLDSPSADATAKMWIRMDGSDGKPRSYSVADSPTAGAGWTQRELNGKVDADAAWITLGFLSRGKGTMSIDGVSLAFYD
jgi:hypothetical protein